MLTTMRIMSLAFMSSVVMLVIAVSFVFPDDRFAAPSALRIGAIVAATVGLHLLVSSVCYRAPALPHGLSPDAAARKSAATFFSGWFLRAALTEPIVLVTLATGFVWPDGAFLSIVIAALCALALMAVHLPPREAAIAKVEANLERDGAVSNLREGLGLPRRGAIQEL